jgi:hypothetical protein
MLSGQPTFAFLDAIATAIETLFGSPAVMKVGLFTGAPTLDTTTTLSALVALAPGFTGYAAATVTAHTRRSNGNVDQIIPMGTASFQPTAPVVSPVIVTGVYLADATDLYLAELLTDDNGVASPFAFNSEGDALDVIYEVFVRNATIYGGVAVWNGV